jgi:hypothetical protein
VAPEREGERERDEREGDRFVATCIFTIALRNQVRGFIQLYFDYLVMVVKFMFDLISRLLHDVRRLYSDLAIFRSKCLFPVGLKNNPIIRSDRIGFRAVNQ